MNISPDQSILLDLGTVKISATLVFTWLTIALLAGLARWGTRKLSSTSELSPWQNLMEVLVEGIESQIADIARQDPRPFLPFVATLFIFIAACNVLAVVPGYQAPTGSLSTATALALCVFVAVPLYGIRRQGWLAYLRNYLRPTALMLPLNIVGELARTLALAITEGVFDAVALERIGDAERAVRAAAMTQCPQIGRKITAGADLDEGERSALLAVATAAVAKLSEQDA